MHSPRTIFEENALFLGNTKSKRVLKMPSNFVFKKMPTFYTNN
jgi:hypothetical protein